MPRRSSEGSDATLDPAVYDLKERLSQLRSFILWTVPLYAAFVVAGLAASQYVWSSDLSLLVGALAAFGALDGIALQRIRAIEGRALSTVSELEATRDQVDRLARFLLRAGVGLGASFGLLVLVLVVT